jgi:hypothetical protein
MVGSGPSTPGSLSRVGSASGPLESPSKAYGSSRKLHINGQQAAACTHFTVRYLQWWLALLACGLIIATSYASSSIYQIGETTKEILKPLEVSSDTVELVDVIVDLVLLLSWILAGGAIIGARCPDDYGCSLTHMT